MYISHIRSEGAGLLEAIDELIEIARRSGARAEVYHLKAAGMPHWPKMDQAIARIAARACRGYADHCRHVSLHRFGHRAGQHPTHLGAGRRSRSHGGATEAARDARTRPDRAAEQARDWSSRPTHRVQEPGAAAVRRQAADRDRRGARRHRRGDGDRSRRRRRQPGGDAFPQHVRREPPQRAGPALGKFRLGCRRNRHRAAVYRHSHASACLRQFRAAAGPLCS